MNTIRSTIRKGGYDSKVVCSRCLMDTSTKYITFDSNGICNYCTNYLKIYKTNKKIDYSIDRLINDIRKKSKGNNYDCIVGVSGGVDSSAVLVDVVNRGLKPLAVHMDNGWNSELAQYNIETLVKALDVELFTYVIDWSEYKALLKIMCDSDVIDLELLYDNAMYSVNWRLANKFNIKYILSGMNISSEGIAIPEDWAWIKYDKRNIKAFGKIAGINKLKSFPSCGVLDYIVTRLKGIKWIHYLDYINYDKQKSLEDLEANFGYKRYSHKHYESIFTRFYQGYILPRKFKVDKRLCHYSSLIMSGMITRKEGIELLKKPPYPSEELLKNDIKYICKKMSWSMDELDEYINRPERKHNEFPSESFYWYLFLKINKNLKKYFSTILQFIK